MDERSIVVGVDGGPGGETATTWATRWALPATTQLRLVHCIDESWFRGVRTAGARRATEEHAREALRLAGQRAVGGARRPPRDVFCWGDPKVRLLAEAVTAELLVVGRRRHRFSTGSTLGSTAVLLADRSPVPVAVVPFVASPAGSGEGGAGGGPVVAGVDGSAASRGAVRLAARYAAASHVALHLVAVVSLESPGLPRSAHEYRARLVRVERARRDDLDQCVRTLAQDVPSLEVATSLVEGPLASDALRRAAPDARLLVVGHRGRGGLLSTLLGSTADTLLRHAEVPVLVVPVGAVADPARPPAVVPAHST